MAKITLRLDTRRQKKDKTYPLKISVHRNGKTMHLPTGVFLQSSEWDKKRQEVIKRNDRRVLNITLQEKVSALEARLLRLQIAGKLRQLTDKQLLYELSGESDNMTPLLFADYFKRFISTINNKRTKELYQATEKKLIKFDAKYSQLTFEEMSSSWLKAFEASLEREGNSINSRSIHLRNIRAVFNAALADDIITIYPFHRFKIKSQQTIKRALTKEQLLALWSADVPEFRRKYVDMFFLGFFLMGINIVDMARLQPFEGERIVYERAKTHKLYDIKVEPEALNIIRKYQGNKALLSFFDNAKSYRSIANRQNYNLKLIGVQLGIKNLTYYCCRHTWATLASEINISDEVIGMALGHSNHNVTDVYIKRNRKKVDEANRAVIDYLFDKNNKN